MSRFSGRENTDGTRDDFVRETAGGWPGRAQADRDQGAHALVLIHTETKSPIADTKACRPCAKATESRDPALTRMLSLIRDHWRLNRTAVSPDTDRLVESIRRRLDCPVHEFVPGQEVLTWIVPQHWRVREAWLARVNGERVVDFAESPLHLWTHSVSFQGVLSREALEPHLHHDPTRPERVPYHFVNGYRYEKTPTEWGFCLSHNQYRNLTEDRYRVFIDADLDDRGTMKVIDHHLPGRDAYTVFFAAHTCHPGMVTDGLSNVAVLVELFDRLARRPNRRCSYRLILGPEYFGAAAFLANAPPEVLDNLSAGVYVDLVGNGQPFGLAPSVRGDTFIDRVLANVLEHRCAEPGETPIGPLATNDEIFYDGPGFEIPTAAFGGLIDSAHHTDADHLDQLDQTQLRDGLDFLTQVVDILETDHVPARNFRGPLYLSRYGLFTSVDVDPREYEWHKGIQVLMDGRRSCFDIAHQLNADFMFVRSFCEALETRGLVRRTEATPVWRTPEGHGGGT